MERELTDEVKWMDADGVWKAPLDDGDTGLGLGGCR
jgi:hypothetical protein